MEGNRSGYPLRKVIAPLILSLFSIAWYQFSAIYLVEADQEALSRANFAVYVNQPQLAGYLEATRWICYVIVYVGLILFWQALVKFVRSREVIG